MRSVDRLSVLCMPIDRQSSSYSMFLSLYAWRTRKAKLARASVRPGSGWNLVPAFATRASVVVGPAKSLLAYLTPFASPDWYWKEPEAGLARPRRWAGRAAWAARCAPRQAVDRESIVVWAPGGGLWMWWGAAMDGKRLGCEVSRCLTSTKFRAPSLSKCLRSTLHWPGHPPHPSFLQVRSPVPSIARQALTFSNFTPMSHR
jgi:hypothetical protein